MKRIFYLLSFLILSCNYSGRNIEAPLQFELSDSSQLIHIKNEFYRNNTGYLYQRTFADREIKGKLTSIEYFALLEEQDLDPLTFSELDGWFAKDKKSVYYYRPTSGGMLISRMEECDVKTFKVLQGHYLYASDKNYVYEENLILENLNPDSLVIIRNKEGRIICLKNDTFEYEIRN